MTTCGAKAATLIALAEAGYPVPEFCVVEADHMTEHLNRCGLHGEPEPRWAHIVRTRPVAAALTRLLCESAPAGERFAVRSSAAVEDGVKDSFAGQFATRLNVPREALPQAVADVWASAFSAHVLEYAAQRGMGKEALQMGVIVQRMLAAEVSGVAFAMDPVDERRDVAIVSAVYGLGEGLVSGDLDADRFEVARSGEVTGALANKAARLVALPEGATVKEVVPAHERDRPCLSDLEARTLATWARDLSRHAGCWQDIEWCLAEDRLWLLQSRPITGLRNTAAPGARLTVWDNANIIESYSGVTTPLTFSFVQHVYSRVYPAFFRFMGVEQTLIDANREIFHMVGLIQGRIYYNLLNWYRALSLLPGYAVNARFMEQMMGVTQGFEVPPAPVAATGNKWWRAGRSVAGLLRSWRSLPRRVTGFHRLVDDTLSGLCFDALRSLDLHALVDRYTTLESTLLNRWQTPLVNDFFAMVFFGVLRKLLAAWCADLDEEFQNQLLCAEQTIISTEPIDRLHEIVDLCRARADLVTLANARRTSEFRRALQHHPDIDALFESLRERFGARTLDELKLETVTAVQDPDILAAQVVAYLNMRTPAAAGPPAEALRAEAEARFNRALGHNPLKRWLGRWVLRHTRRLVAQRENLRFERTRVFDTARNLFIAFGERLFAEQVIDAPRDVFWLTKDELFDFARGTSVDTDLRAIVERRRNGWAGFADTAMADRIETYGSPYVGNYLGPADQNDGAGGDDLSNAQLHGTGCCAGRVTAEALVVTDPREVTSLQGRILVAERTDPGWTPLFPIAAGILVERGSLLSHSAIVARELGKPAVVAVRGLMSRIRSGDLVTFDGSTGAISVIARGGNLQEQQA